MTPDQIDYRELLWKYINHIGNEEGRTYLTRSYQAHRHFSKAELATLLEIDLSARPDWAIDRRSNEILLAR
jgi:hypothetical protein